MTMTSALNANGVGQTLVSGSSINRANEAKEVIGSVTIVDRHAAMKEDLAARKKTATIKKEIIAQEAIAKPAPIPAPRPPKTSSLPQASSNQPEYLEPSYQLKNLSSSTASQESLVEETLPSDKTNVNEPTIEKPVSTSTAADQNSKNIQRAASFGAVSISVSSKNTADKNRSKVDGQQKGHIEYFADLMAGCRPRCFGGRKQSKKLEGTEVVAVEMQATKNGVENE